jgi:hypothetical protein
MWPFKNSPGVDALIAALKHPEQWVSDHFHIRHRPSGLTYWIANGSFAFDGSEHNPVMDGIKGKVTPEMFTGYERRVIWPHVRAMLQAQAALALNPMRTMERQLDQEGR